MTAATSGMMIGGVGICAWWMLLRLEQEKQILTHALVASSASSRLRLRSPSTRMWANKDYLDRKQAVSLRHPLLPVEKTGEASHCTTTGRPDTAISCSVGTPCSGPPTGHDAGGDFVSLVNPLGRYHLAQAHSALDSTHAEQGTPSNGGMMAQISERRQFVDGDPRHHGGHQAPDLSLPAPGPPPVRRKPQAPQVPKRGRSAHSSAQRRSPPATVPTCGTCSGSDTFDLDPSPITGSHTHRSRPSRWQRIMSVRRRSIEASFGFGEGSEVSGSASGIRHRSTFLPAIEESGSEYENRDGSADVEMPSMANHPISIEIQSHSSPVSVATNQSKCSEPIGTSTWRAQSTDDESYRNEAGSLATSESQDIGIARDKQLFQKQLDSEQLQCHDPEKQRAKMWRAVPSCMVVPHTDAEPKVHAQSEQALELQSPSASGSSVDEYWPCCTLASCGQLLRPSARIEAFCLVGAIAGLMLGFITEMFKSVDLVSTAAGDASAAERDEAAAQDSYSPSMGYQVTDAGITLLGLSMAVLVHAISAAAVARILKLHTQAAVGISRQLLQGASANNARLGRLAVEEAVMEHQQLRLRVDSFNRIFGTYLTISTMLFVLATAVFVLLAVLEFGSETDTWRWHDYGRGAFVLYVGVPTGTVVVSCARLTSALRTTAQAASALMANTASTANASYDNRSSASRPQVRSNFGAWSDRQVSIDRESDSHGQGQHLDACDLELGASSALTAEYVGQVQTYFTLWLGADEPGAKFLGNVVIEYRLLGRMGYLFVAGFFSVLQLRLRTLEAQ